MKSMKTGTTATTITHNDQLIAPNKPKKIFAPNIPKHRATTKQNNEFLTPERVLNPTKFDLESRLNSNNNTHINIKEEERQKQIDLEIKQLQQTEINKFKSTTTTVNKAVILKIKRKIDDDALPSILIERPRKKAFLDSFKDFGINSNESEDKDKDDYKLPTSNELSTSPTETKQQKQLATTSIQTPIPQDKDKKLFTLITTLDDPSNNKLLTKFQQRLEEFNQKGVISSPKQLETKKERTNKQRKESRYKQINTNRNLYTKEERELFQDHDVIELERTTLDPNNLMGSTISKEDEALISNYQSLLDEHLGSGAKPMETKYVYDYYYFNPSIDQQSQLLRLHQDNPDSIETVQLPPEDDFYDILDGGASDDSSVDSENWYREYPSSEDDGEGYDDFDDYHGFNKANRKSNSDDEYEQDEYEIDGDYYDQDDYDNEI